MGRKLVFICLAALLFSGCASTPPAPREERLCRVVTQVVVWEENPSGGRQRLYRSQDGMNRILTGISLLGHKYPATELPPSDEPDDYSIILYFSDGKQKLYRYHALRYLFIEGKGWRRVSEKRSEDFLLLMEQLPEE